MDYRLRNKRILWLDLTIFSHFVLQRFNFISFLQDRVESGSVIRGCFKKREKEERNKKGWRKERSSGLNNVDWLFVILTTPVAEHSNTKRKHTTVSRDAVSTRTPSAGMIQYLFN